MVPCESRWNRRRRKSLHPTPPRNHLEASNSNNINTNSNNNIVVRTDTNGNKTTKCTNVHISIVTICRNVGSGSSKDIASYYVVKNRYFVVLHYCFPTHLLNSNESF
mmetsp:Transcript_12405/g.26131  ORF Transcript_12405/g.26131 Transcript_12405/m.26131 type:complete len:107 (-) Transcript_12405:25-345(-)